MFKGANEGFGGGVRGGGGVHRGYGIPFCACRSVNRASAKPELRQRKPETRLRRRETRFCHRKTRHRNRNKGYCIHFFSYQNSF